MKNLKNWFSCLLIFLLSFFSVQLLANENGMKGYYFYVKSDTDKISVFFNQGLSFLKAGDTINAKANALKIIELDPAEEVLFTGKHLLDLYDLGMRRKVVKQSLADAHSYLDEEKSVDSKSLANIKLSGAFQKLINAWLYSPEIGKEDRDLKSTILKDIISVYPRMKDKPDIDEAARKYMVQATASTKEKRYKEAISLWDKVLDIAPYFATGYFNNSLLHELLNDYSEAIADMKMYLELCPDANDARAAKDKIYEWEGKLQPLEEIVKKYSVANKVDKIKDFSTIKITAKMSMTGMGMKTSSTMEIWLKNPDKIKTITITKGIKSISLIDGENGYMIIDNGKPVKMTSDQTKQTLSSNLFRNSLAEYLKNGQLSLEGEEKVNGKPAFKLKVSSGGAGNYIYIDKESYFLVRTTIPVNQGGQSITYDSYQTDFNETNGFILPMSQTTTSPGMEMVLTYEKVEVNIPMEDSIFKVR